MTNRLILPLILAAVLAPISSAAACVISFGPPSDKELRATQNELAFKARIAMIELAEPPRRAAGSSFVLQLQVVEPIKGTPDEQLTVFYGPCLYVPGKVGEIVNVIAVKSRGGQYQAAYR